MKKPLHILFASGSRVEINASESPWVTIAPAGRFKTHDGKFTQVLNAGVFSGLVSWFDTIGAKLKRVLGFNSVPVFLGHPDFAPDKWPQRVKLGEVSALRTDGDALQAQIAWNAEGRKIINDGKHIYPSAAWDCEAGDAPGEILPAMLWSVGFWHRPNISGVPPVLAINAAPDDSPQTNTPTTMLNKLKQWLVSLGLIAEADDDTAAETALDSAITEYNAMREKLTAAETAKAQAEADKIKADEAVTTVNALLKEKATANANLIQERDKARGALIARVAAHAVSTGIISKADEDKTITALNADFDKEDARLKAAAPAIPIKQPLHLGKERGSISSIKAAQTQINAWCEEKGGNYIETYKASKTEPALKDAWAVIAAADKSAAAE